MRTYHCDPIIEVNFSMPRLVAQSILDRFQGEAPMAVYAVECATRGERHGPEAIRMAAKRAQLTRAIFELTAPKAVTECALLKRQAA
jgi:hypothetical protein